MQRHIKQITLTTLTLSAAISVSLAMPKTSTMFEQKNGSHKFAGGLERGQEQDQEKPVKMKDLPAAVQKTVREQSQGAIIRGLSQETENGKTNYEVELKINGHNKDVLIDPNGVVVEIEEQVTLESLPPAVRTTIEQNAGAGKIGMIESITEGNAVVAYEAHIRKAGKSREIKVGADGKLIPKGKG